MSCVMEQMNSGGTSTPHTRAAILELPSSLSSAGNELSSACMFPAQTGAEYFLSPSVYVDRHGHLQSAKLAEYTSTQASDYRPRAMSHISLMVADCSWPGATTPMCPRHSEPSPSTPQLAQQASKERTASLHARGRNMHRFVLLPGSRSLRTKTAPLHSLLEASLPSARTH